jgi:GntR family transcriptional regulator
MEFTEPKPIYRQIAEQMGARILAGEWQEGQRIPSVRELAAAADVNPNTVTKSYQALLDREIIENRRGLGYFVAAGARERIVAHVKEEFVRDELPRLYRTMRLLGLRLEDLAPYFAQSNEVDPPVGPDGVRPLDER